MAQISKSTNNAIPFITATIGCGVFSLAFGPLFFAAWPLVFGASKLGMGQDIDDLTEEDTQRIIAEAKRQRENNVVIKQTIPSNGALFNIPMTRKWNVVFDEEDFED